MLRPSQLHTLFTRRIRWSWKNLALLLVAGLALALGLIKADSFWRVASAAAQGGGGSKGAALPNFDIRGDGPSAAPKVSSVSQSAIAAQAQAQVQSIKNGLAALRVTAPQAEADLSPFTSALEVLRSPNGLTQAAQGQDAQQIVRAFLQSNRSLYGLTSAEVNQLHFFGESKSPASGIRMVRVEQLVNGRPVFQSETRFSLDRDGRIFRSVGLMIPGATAAAPALNVASLITPQQALVSALSSVKVTANAAGMTTKNTNADDTETEVVANIDYVAGDVPTRLVYFSVAPGVLVPAWSQIIFTSGPDADWYTLVDAKTGLLLWRKNIRNFQTQDARFRVYVQADGKTPADSPAPQSPTTATPGSSFQAPAITPTIVSMNAVKNALASSFGWIFDCPAGGCTANETQTLGNNVHAYMDAQQGANANLPDTSAAFVLDGNGKPTGNPDANGRNRDFLGTSPRDFQTNFLPPPQSGNPESGQTCTGSGNNGTLAIDQFRRGMVTHLFYLSNWYHDQLYALGFDEPAGNFQLMNNTGVVGGVAGDRVLAEADDGSGTNNANFSTPPDGMSGRMQMYRFTGPTIDRDGSLDAEIVLHELTHGTSNRLIGNGAGLNWDVGGSMGEGWSDFYALSLLNNTNADNPDGQYAAGAYATYKLGGLLDNYVYGIRRFPYSTDNSVNPLTWADIDNVTYNEAGGIASSPLGFGDNGALEVHNGGELWCLTLWEVRSRIIAANGGNVPLGSQKTLQIVTDAMKLTPINPSFVQARDALIDADCMANACANEASIWGGFADRGLGYKALAPQAYAFGYSAGHIGITESFDLPNLALQSVAINDGPGLGNGNGVPDPGETILLTVTLKNPWRSTTKNLASATGTLTALTAGVTVTDNSSTYGAIPAQGAAAGDTFRFTVPTGATCGQSLDFTLGTTSALGAGTLNLKLRVGTPGGTGAPVTYTSTIAGGLAIPDNAPRGVFNTLNVTDDYEIADIDFRVDNLTHTFTGDLTVLLKAPNGYGNDYISLIGGLTDGGSGDNIVNMVIDDDLPQLAANDMVQALPAAAPYTKSWLPTFNAPWSTLAGFGPSDPVGQLSRLDGTSTRGTWTVLVSDQAAADTGTLNAWSMIVTPRAFTCAQFAAVTATKSTSSTFQEGGSVTYTVTLTNNGTGAVPDNVGNEFTDTLPSQLTLITVSVSSGTATSMGNTVNWNGSIPANGGTVTITITATVNAGTGGQTASNQGTVSYDNDLNGSNNATVLTDDPSTVAANDPTSRTIIPTCMLTCPASITVGTTGASAVVNYPAPTSTGTCGTITCTPPSGSAFNVGTTTVNCSSSVGAQSCSFTVTVDRVTYSISDPLACTGPGNAVTGTFTVTNSGVTATSVNATVTLPPGLVGVPNSGSATVGNAPAVTNTSVTYTNPALAPGQTATITYQAQVGDVPTGTTLTTNLVVSFGGGPALTVPANVTVNCPAVGPGALYPAGAEVSDQKAGSVLIYNYYTSDVSSPATNTRISLTNTSLTRPIGVHLFFVDGATCSIADAFICLTQNQTVSLLASDYDPGTTGYVIAVASDVVRGCPVNFNYLIGDEFVKTASGFQANLGAEAVAAIAGGLVVCNDLSVFSTLNFDGLSYNRLPRVLAADNIADNASGNSTQLVINRIGGDLSTGASRLGTLFGVLYDDIEQSYSFQLPGGTCQVRGTISGTFPRTVPRVEQIIPAGRSGWLKLYDGSSANAALLGAQLVNNANVAASANAFRGGHNLHKLTLAPATSITIPVFAPNCRF